MCSDHPRTATPTEVMWGEVSDVVNHAKFRQLVKGFLPGGGVKVYHFPTLSATTQPVITQTVYRHL